MSLDNIYDKTDNARDNLVNAIRTMGVTVAEDSTINQCANAILMIPSGGGGETKFYQCASVDTSAKTWTGHELILADGKYTVSETLTEGLGYTSKVPVAENYYTEDVLIQLLPYMEWKAPTEGLVFYAPLAEESATAETGQTLTTIGDVSYTTVNSIPCVFISGSSGYVSAPASTLPSGAEPRSICFWVMWSNARDRFVGYGGDEEDSRFCVGTGDTSNLVQLDAAYNNYCQSSVYPRTDTLTFLAVLYDGNELSLYIDGKLASKETAALNTTADSVLKIGYWNNSYKMSTGYISSVRCYNRVLSVSEIATLASEFTPTE